MLRWEAYFGGAIRFLSDHDKTAIVAYDLLHIGAYRGETDAARPASFVIDRNGFITYAHAAANILDRPDATASLDACAAAARQY